MIYVQLVQSVDKNAFYGFYCCTVKQAIKIMLIFFLLPIILYLCTYQVRIQFS